MNQDNQNKTRKRLITPGVYSAAGETGKLPPQAVDLEEAVLGALMLEKNALNAVVEFLKPEHFQAEPHRAGRHRHGAADARQCPVDTSALAGPTVTPAPTPDPSAEP